MTEALHCYSMYSRKNTTPVSTRSTGGDVRFTGMAVWLSLALVAAGVCGVSAQNTARPCDEVTETAFKNPSDDSRPWVYWYWLDGNLTKEGITADLEAMKRTGIGGAMIMEVSVTIPPGPVRSGTPEWREMFHFTLTEAERLGLKIKIGNDPGWAGSGGPWITPELAQKKLVWTETPVKGPVRFDAVLPLPKKSAYYRDVAVWAFPTPAGDSFDPVKSAPVITSNCGAGASDLGKLLSGTAIVPLSEPGKDKAPYIQFEYPGPFTARTLSFVLREMNVFANGNQASPDSSKFQIELQTSRDGQTFTKAAGFEGQLAAYTLGFPPVTSRFFRVVFTGAWNLPKSAEKTPPRMLLRFLCLGPGARLSNLEAKTFVTRGESTPQSAYPEIAKELTVDTAHMVDLSSHVDDKGRLVWDVPPGEWTILRMGQTSMNTVNHPAPKEGTGLECDKLSKDAMDVHFAGYVGKLVSEAGPLAGKTFSGTHIDSWEAGPQNWTKRLPEEFLARRGYDLSKYLPVFTGRIVDSQEKSERFLWDFRRTLADLMAENYAGHLRELANEKGLSLSIEAYGGVAPSDDLVYGAQADVPMCEFWWQLDRSTQPYHARIDMPSVAHVYGKPVVAAEAFTANNDERYLAHPGNMKALGDWAFAMGINQFYIHVYTMQPWMNRKPGMCMNVYGTHYGRNQTWWEQSKPWHEYLARCQEMLRKGLYVADICYLTPERAPQVAHLPLALTPLPGRPGYNFDAASAEAVMTRFSVKDGKLVLPDGMSYRVLVLPDVETMTPGLLRKIKDLVAEGATVVGRRPQKSPGLSGYPDCDTEVRALAGELWGDCDGVKIKERSFGKGKIFCGMTAEEVLKKMGVAPDFEPSGPLRYIHRACDGTDIYFVSNPDETREADVAATFRVSGKVPELWYPDSGKTGEAGAFSIAGGLTTVPLHFDPSGSVFVVFRKETKEANRVAPKAPVKENVLDIGGSWNVSFPPGWGTPEKVTFDHLASWSEQTDPGVKYFSGTATYTKKFDVPAGKENGRWYLDLGKVAVIAEVKLNGKDLGILWKPPFRADITEAIKAGTNDLEVKVTNLWPNRLIGDEQLPEDSVRVEAGAVAPTPRWLKEHGGSSSGWAEWRNGHIGTVDSWPQWLLDGKPSPTGRLTFTNWRLWKKDDKLQPSGLLGPVTVFQEVNH